MHLAVRSIEAAFKLAVVLKGFRGGLEMSTSWLLATLSLGYYSQGLGYYSQGDSERSKTSAQVERKTVEASAKDVGFSASARRLPKELG